MHVCVCACVRACVNAHALHNDMPSICGDMRGCVCTFVCMCTVCVCVLCVLLPNSCAYRSVVLHSPPIQYIYTVECIAATQCVLSY